MAEHPFDAQKLYHFLKDHPGWEMVYHERSRLWLLGPLPGLPRHWVELRNPRRDILVKIPCDRRSVDEVILDIAAVIDQNPYVQPEQLQQLG